MSVTEQDPDPILGKRKFDTVESESAVNMPQAKKPKLEESAESSISLEETMSAMAETETRTNINSQGKCVFM